MARFDQGGCHVPPVFELYGSDVASEGGRVAFGGEPAPRPHRQQLDEKVPGGLPAFSLLRWAGEQLEGEGALDADHPLGVLVESEGGHDVDGVPVHHAL